MVKKIENTAEKEVKTPAKPKKATTTKKTATTEKTATTKRTTTKTPKKQAEKTELPELRMANPDEIREAVKKIREKKAKAPKTFWSYIKALHAIEGLSDWLTLEAMPLMPLAEKKDDSIVFHLLFVSPNGNKTIGKPWGMSSLALPEAKVLAKTKFDAAMLEKMPVPETKMLCNKKFIDLIQKAFDENGKIPLPPKEVLDIYQIIAEKAAKKASEKNSETAKNEQKPATELNWSAVFKYMDNLSKMLKEDGQNELMNELLRIKKRLEQPLFSVAVVGEFSRGKSTFLNDLIGKELLPAGDLPTTAMLTKIVYGNKQKFFRFYNGKKEEISIETLENLVADDNGNDPSGVILAETPFKFLDKNGIQFIDTPGAGDIFGSRAAITTETIASCDATIVTVSATMPLSLTEKSFVEDNIFLKQIPRVAVVVTRLDQVPEKEREKVYEHIKIEVDKWQKNIPVWVSGLNIKRWSKEIVFGKDEILAEIAKWSQHSDNDKIRMRQIYAQTQLIQQRFAQILNERKIMLQTGKEEYAKQLKKEEQTVLNQDVVWDEISLEIEKRELAFGEWLRKIIDEKVPDIKEDILYQVQNCPDPQKWWNETFPYVLKKKIQGLSKELSAVINRKVAAESEQAINFIRQKLDPKFAFNRQNLPTENIDSETNLQNLDKMNGKNLERTRTISRFASVAAFMLSVPLTPLTGGFPVGMALSAVAGVISEKVIKGKIDRQRDQVARHVDSVMDAAFGQIVESSKAQIAKTYAAIIKEIKNEKRVWLENAKKNFAKIEDSDIAKQLDDLEKKITSLSKIN
ncbi:dynamin family protein [bacterium]|nr:dynamin family protein [bacterium]